MKCRMYAFVERNLNGTWALVASDVYTGQSYPLFARLAGVRNESEITPLSKPRGLPSVESGGTYSFGVRCERYRPGSGWDDDHRITSWLTLDELESVKWEKFFDTHKGGGEWLDTLSQLRELAQGDPASLRMIFWFDDTTTDSEELSRIEAAASRRPHSINV